MTPADSPENKCPRCGSEDPLVIGEACGYHPLHTPHRWHVEAPRVDGSGRINTSGGATADCDQSSSERNGEVPPSAESQGQAPPVESSAGEADDREASEGRSHAELTFASSPAVDPQCPDCGGMGSDEGGFRGGKKWKAICPSCGGSGRSPVDSGTGTDEKDARPPIDVYAELEGGNWEKWYSAYCDLWELFVNRDAEAVQAESEVELLRASVPSSPHETGGQHYMSVEPTPEGWCVLCSSDDCEHSVEGRLSPSAAPTNPGDGSRSDSEGEGLAARIEEVELSLKQADEELARVTKAAITGPDGYLYHWCPGVGWCPGCPPSAVPKEEA